MASLWYQLERFVISINFMNSADYCTSFIIHVVQYCLEPPSVMFLYSDCTPCCCILPPPLPFPLYLHPPLCFLPPPPLSLTLLHSYPYLFSIPHPPFPPSASHPPPSSLSIPPLSWHSTPFILFPPPSTSSSLPQNLALHVSMQSRWLELCRHASKPTGPRRGARLTVPTSTLGSLTDFCPST